MNKKGQQKLGLIIMMVFTIITAIALLNPIADSQSILTSRQTITNDIIDTSASVAGSGQVNVTDQFNVTNAYGTGDYRNTACPFGGVVLTNSSGTVYTVNTDYVFTTAYGNFTLKNTAKVNQSVLSDNLTYVTYTYCQAGYNNDAGSRGIGGLPTLFAVLALLAVAFYGIREFL